MIEKKIQIILQAIEKGSGFKNVNRELTGLQKTASLVKTSMGSLTGQAAVLSAELLAIGYAAGKVWHGIEQAHLRLQLQAGGLRTRYRHLVLSPTAST